MTKPPSAAAETPQQMTPPVCAECGHLISGRPNGCYSKWCPIAKPTYAETPEILLWLVQYKDEWCAAYPTKRQAEVYACGFSHPELITILEGRFRQTSSATLGDTP